MVIGDPSLQSGMSLLIGLEAAVNRYELQNFEQAQVKPITNPNAFRLLGPNADLPAIPIRRESYEEDKEKLAEMVRVQQLHKQKIVELYSNLSTAAEVGWPVIAGGGILAGYTGCKLLGWLGRKILPSRIISWLGWCRNGIGAVVRSPFKLLSGVGRFFGQFVPGFVKSGISWMGKTGLGRMLGAVGRFALSRPLFFTGALGVAGLLAYGAYLLIDHYNKTKNNPVDVVNNILQNRAELGSLTDQSQALMQDVGHKYVANSVGPNGWPSNTMVLASSGQLQFTLSDRYVEHLLRWLAQPNCHSPLEAHKAIQADGGIISHTLLGGKNGQFPVNSNNIVDCFDNRVRRPRQILLLRGAPLGFMDKPLMDRSEAAIRSEFLAKYGHLGLQEKDIVVLTEPSLDQIKSECKRLQTFAGTHKYEKPELLVFAFAHGETSLSKLRSREVFDIPNFPDSKIIIEKEHPLALRYQGLRGHTMIMGRDSENPNFLQPLQKETLQQLFRDHFQDFSGVLLIANSCHSGALVRHDPPDRFKEKTVASNAFGSTNGNLHHM